MVWPRYYKFEHKDHYTMQGGLCGGCTMQGCGHWVRTRRKEINFKILVYVGIALMFITSTLFAPILFFGFVVYR
jgi:hypothetical protein